MKNNPAFFYIILLLVALAVLLVSPLVTVVSISDNSRRTLVEVPIQEGDLISVNYTHSVEKTPVNETYAVFRLNYELPVLRFV